MIKKLQRRFIHITLAALTVAMVLVVTLVNLFNWVSVRRELQETLTVITESSTKKSRDGDGFHKNGKNKHSQNMVKEARWFSVLKDPEASLSLILSQHTADPDEETAFSLAEQALNSGRQSAFLQDYLYQITDDPDGGQTVYFLNCETRVTAVRTLALLSVLSCLGGILLAWLFVTLASRKALTPMIQNMEQQKQFITNASHELKTPLTVISTNMELLEMEAPGNQWVQSTRKQTALMRHLVDELVYLSRMEEESTPLTMEKLELSDLLSDTAEPFLAMAEFKGLDMKLELEKPLPVNGDRASLSRLFSTLCDNALKYASDSGPILLCGKAEGRHITVSFSNAVSEPLSELQCEELFHRFYRMDSSRSKTRQKGFGIGLAIAAAIMEKHGGTIKAVMEKNNRLAIICSFGRRE